ncbi:Monoterpene epsilon-lactone hydrolase [Globisporangium polare]
MSDDSSSSFSPSAAATGATVAGTSTQPQNGFSAPYATLPVFLVLTAAALWANEHLLQGLGAPLVLVIMTVLFCVHELLRPFCCSLSELCLLLVRVMLAVVRAALEFVLRGCKPRFPEWTLGWELFHAVASTAGEQGGVHITKPLNVVGFRRVFDALGNATRGLSCRKHGTTAEFFQHNGLEHIWLKPSTAPASREASEQIVVLYFHGGGYSLCSPRSYVDFGNRLRSHVAKAVASRVNANNNNDSEPESEPSTAGPSPVVHVLLANYRKLPEHQFPAPVDDAMAMYDYLVKHQRVPSSHIVIAGDSAGGGLTIATLLRLRNAGRAMPAAALVTCPYVDMMLASVEKSKHCFISKSMLEGIRDQCVAAVTAPRANQPPSATSVPKALQEAVTVNADLTGLPPLFILAGEFDILYPQSLGLEETARLHGVDVEIDIHSHMPHVFCLLPANIMSQSEVGIANLAAFAAKHVVPARVG